MAPPSAPRRAMRLALALLVSAAAVRAARTPLAAAATLGDSAAAGASAATTPPPPVQAASISASPGRIELVARGRVAPGVDDRSYGVQVPRAADAAEGALCRRVDAGGALALRLPQPLPPDAAIGATVGLKLKAAAGDGNQGAAPQPLTLRAIGAGSGGGAGSSSGGLSSGGVDVRGPFASVPLAALQAPGAAPFEGVELARAADAPGPTVVCVEDWSVDGAA